MAWKYTKRYFAAKKKGWPELDEAIAEPAADGCKLFQAPPAEHCEGYSTTDLVKRVVGVPGDCLTSEGSTIFVNGQPLHEKWPP
jgi:hypothetical protein